MSSKTLKEEEEVEGFDLEGAEDDSAEPMDEEIDEFDIEDKVIQEEEEEQEEVEEVEVKKEKKKKMNIEKKRKYREGKVKKKKRPVGSRNRLIQGYNAHLMKIRGSSVKNEDGENVRVKKERKIRLKAGTKAKAESKYLKQNGKTGTFIHRQKLRRSIKNKMINCAKEFALKREQWNELALETGKNYAPGFKKEVGKWSISADAISLLRNYVQLKMDDMAQASHKIHTNAGRITLKPEDLHLAIELVN